MQESLQKFNYEVFVSKTMLDDILRMKVFKEYSFSTYVLVNLYLTKSRNDCSSIKRKNEFCFQRIFKMSQLTMKKQYKKT